ncbi:Domain of unknown function DUF3533 [Ceraceosorus bombacis]|uniref:DUF3533 domain-containing protein n=1 Tax=Ceraceosorus bombacis TaxID=401625 RepID=A0A0P1BIT1_9BASI|nr:Domain of unknown function DUF3533 [Ceraceosorus bombacis]
MTSQSSQGDASAASDKPRIASSDDGVGFWHPSIRPLVKAYLIGLMRVTIMISVVIWTLVALYWASLYREVESTPNIDAAIIDRDGGLIGSTITQQLLAINASPAPRLTWRSVSPSAYPTSADVEKAVAIDFDTWLIIEIAQGATTRLEAARAAGDASWNPNSVVTLTYAEARNQVGFGLIMTLARSSLQPVLANINTQLAARYLTSLGANSAAAITALSNAPSTIANPVAMTTNNVRPYSQPVATAATFVGLIYLCILAFNVVMAGFGMRAGMGLNRKLNLRSLILARILLPAISYIFLSLMFSLLEIAFELDFKAMGYTYGAGFMVWFCFTYTGMLLLGLMTEAFLSLVGAPFIGFCLILIIIVNVAVSNLPIELQNEFFKYGYAMPFYNLKQSYLTIVFNVGKRSDLFKYAGILWVWIIVVIFTFPIWIWLERKREIKAASAPPRGPPPSAQKPVTDEEAQKDEQ